MVTAVELVPTLVVMAAHTLGTAVAVRFFRIRMKTRGGWILYSLLVTPFLLFVSTAVLGQVLPPPGTSNRLVVLVLLIGVPLAVGFTVELLYVPPPDDYELPDTRDG